MGQFTLPPIQIHARIAAAPAEIRPWSIDQMGIRKLGNGEHRGRGVRVGIIDTGIDDRHMSSGDLKHAFRGGKDFTGSAYSFLDIHGHGTHVAGIVAGVERKNGGTGVAPAADLYIAKGLGDDGTGDDRSIAEAALWLRFDCKCHVINLSLGGPQRSPLIVNALLKCVADGCIVIVASGNEGDYSTSWPANDNSMISVAATDQKGQPADFSSPSSVDVATAGVKILSLYSKGTYSVMSGTSMAAPHFTGFTAIYLGDCLALGLALPNQEAMFAKIVEWTQDIGKPGQDVKTGHGLLSPEKYKSRAPEPVASQKGINLGIGRLYMPARAGDWLSIGP